MQLIHTLAVTHTHREQRILAKVLTLLCMDFKNPRCEVMFSLVAMAMLERREKNGYNNKTGLGDEERPWYHTHGGQVKCSNLHHNGFCVCVCVWQVGWLVGWWT